jgi:hypothetical protein
MATVASMQPPDAPTDPAWVPSPLYRMSLEQYEAMIAFSAFTKRDRVPLKNDYLVEKMTESEVHTNPGPAGYASRQEFAAGQQIPVVIGGMQVGMIAVDNLLP